MSFPLEAPFNIISIYQRFAQPRLISVSDMNASFFFFQYFGICLLTAMEELLCSWFDDEILLIP